MRRRDEDSQIGSRVVARRPTHRELRRSVVCYAVECAKNSPGSAHQRSARAVDAALQRSCYAGGGHASEMTILVVAPQLQPWIERRRVPRAVKTIKKRRIPSVVPHGWIPRRRQGRTGRRLRRVLGRRHRWIPRRVQRWTRRRLRWILRRRHRGSARRMQRWRSRRILRRTHRGSLCRLKRRTRGRLRRGKRR